MNEGLGGAWEGGRTLKGLSLSTGRSSESRRVPAEGPPARLWFCTGTPRATHAVWLLNPQIRWTKSPWPPREQEAGGGGTLPGAEVSSSFSEQWPSLVLALSALLHPSRLHL